MTFEQSDIRFFYFTLTKRFGELSVGEVAFCDQDYAGRVFVKSMHDSGAERIATLRQGLTAAKQSIHQCPARIPRAGVHGHAGSFVHCDDVFILVDNIEGNRFGFSPRRRARLHVYADALPSMHMMRTLGGPRIDQHQGSLNEFLCARAADVESRANHAIKTLSFIALGDYKFLERS